MASVFHRAPSRRYPKAVRAQGVYIWDESGKRYLDGASGALVANIGHGREELARLAAEQTRTLNFVHSSQFTSDPLEQCAARLSAFTPSGAEWFFWPVLSGSAATESAIKLARQYHVERGEPQRYRIISRWTAYHGASLGAVAASGLIQRRAIYEPLLNADAFPKIGKPDPRRSGQEDAAQLEELILALGPETVAAFIAEPIIGAADAALAPAAGYYEEIRRICSAYGVLFIVDEVMTGLGRTGRGFAITYWDALPDVIIVGKGLAAGYAPLAGVLASKAVHDTIRDGSGALVNGFTYGGHPVTLAIGAEVLAIVERERLVERSFERGQRLLAGLRQLQAAYPFISEARGHGLMAGLVLADPETGQPFARPGLAHHVAQAAWARGLILYPGTGAADGVRGDHILIGPPLTIEPPELAELLETLGAALEDGVSSEVLARFRHPPAS